MYTFCFDNMNIEMHYVLCKMCKIKVKKDCLWKQKTQNQENRILGKTQAIPLKFWFRILVPDFLRCSWQIQIDLPHKLKTRQSQTKCLFPVWFDDNVCCTTELARAGLRPTPHVAYRELAITRVFSLHGLFRGSQN